MSPVAKAAREPSITRRISLLLLLMILISTTSVAIFSYVLHRSDTINANAERAGSIADSVAASISGDRLRGIMESREKDDYWYAIKASLDGVMSRTGVTYLYVLDQECSDTITYFAEGHVSTDETSAFDLGETDDASSYADEMFATLATGQTIITDIYVSGDYGTMVSGFAPILDSHGVIAGVVGVDLAVSQVLASSDAFGMQTVIITLSSCLLFGLLCTWMISRMVGRPIRALTTASDRIAEGDMDVTLTIRSRDEIGRLSASFSRMIESTKQQVSVLQTLADGDLTQNIAPRSEKDTMNIALGRTIDYLNDMFREIYESTAQVSSASTQIADGAQILAQGATEQASTMDMLADSIEDISGKTRDNAAMARKAVDLAGAIRENAERGSHQMSAMIDAVREIDKANQSIGSVMHVIDDIASQINILAINASIEAARAGQHGKGFAVVADEVRNLAVQSATSAQDTESLIESTIAKTALGVRIAGETSESLEQIVMGIAESNRIIGGIAQASDEQEIAITSVNASMGQVTQVVQQNSATAQESAAASNELSGQADNLEELLSHFKLKGGALPRAQEPLALKKGYRR